MTDLLAAARHELVLANRILSREGVFDAFGHVSARHPERADRYLIACSRPPNRVGLEDVVVLDLDSRPAAPTERRLYAECAIHGAIYRARPDVTAVCHHHAKAMLPYCAVGEPPFPISQLGAAAGAVIPVWDSRDGFGDTNLLVATPPLAESLAAALGPHWTVLMRRHGVTVAGRTLREAVFRAIHACENAEALTRARALGTPEGLSAGELRLVSKLTPGQAERSWEYWRARLEGSP